MIVTKIELSNFRNYDSLSLELDDKTNILYGKNAQGKTNVLEAFIFAVQLNHIEVAKMQNL